MDVIKEIEEKLENISSIDRFKYLGIVMLHINRAELYYQIGLKNAEDEYFNDVIYRSNQAYEGILKEAYTMFEGESAENKSLFDIEKYFSKENIFHERVKKLFENYRKEWRNPSTHDYTLLFSKGEAFLALHNVQSFIYILIDQMIERASYLNEAEVLRNSKSIKEMNTELSFNTSLDLSKYITSQITEFMRLNRLDGGVIGVKANENGVTSFKEMTAIGQVMAFLEYKNSDIKYIRDELIEAESHKYRPDVIAIHGDNKVVIEFKRFSANSKVNLRAKLRKYMEISGIEAGIGFNIGTANNAVLLEEELLINGIKSNITIINPFTEKHN